GISELVEREGLLDHLGAAFQHAGQLGWLQQAPGEDEGAAVELRMPERGLLEPRERAEVVRTQVQRQQIEPDRAQDLRSLAHVGRRETRVPVGLERKLDQFRQESLLVDDQNLHQNPRGPTCPGKCTVVTGKIWDWLLELFLAPVFFGGLLA